MLVLNETIDEELKLECFESRIIGVFFIFYFLAGIFLNGKLIWIIFKNKKLHTPTNYLNFSQAVLNLFFTLVEFPLSISNAFNCGFLFEKTVCTFIGFILTFTYACNLGILMLISIERYFVVCKPFTSYAFNLKRCIASIISIMLYNLIWVILPLTGWSEYSFDNSRLTCIVSEDLLREDSLSFSISIFICVFAAPILVIIYTNITSILAVKKATQKFVNDRRKQKKMKKEGHLTKIVIITITAFFISYLPYYILVYIKPFTQIIYFLKAYIFALLFGRSAFTWPPLLNLVLSKDIRLYVFNKNNQVDIVTNNQTK